MTSLGYNTFTNQCIICLQEPIIVNNIISDDVKLLNEMHFLIKSCDCICYSHHSCIETWTKSNSVCPICRKPISFPQNTIIKVMSINNGNGSIHNGSLDTDLSDNVPLVSQPIDNCKATLSVYLFFCILILFSLALSKFLPIK